MCPRKETSIVVRKFISRLFKKGKSYREIAKIVGRSHSCVQKIIGRFKSDGLIENDSGKGRKSILSDVAKRKALKDIKIDPKLSAVKQAAETSRIMDRSVSAETVRNMIRHAGYSSRVARKKPFISLQNQKKRLEFAKTHRLKTGNFWKKVTFSDESKLNIFGNDGRRTVWRKPNTLWIQKNYVLQLNMVVAPSCDEAHFWVNGYVNKQNCRIWSEANPQVYVETPLHPEKLTVCFALWAGGILGPYFFKNDEGHNVTVNGDRYRAMITNFFIPELNNHDVQELWFQQDGATCHTARATIDLLKDTFGDRLISRFGPVNWPPRSCDLTSLDYFLLGYVK
ncbi:HTH_Tnp_Tc3_2 domain-containing protein [Trichonephila clavipes]|nr:HTH_Tnp_Tc3_2 domain-containing protein [Trichonephila clavipes]